MGKDTDKRWKGFKIDWQEIAEMDAVYQEGKLLTQQHVAILLALLQYQKWDTRWENLEITRGELQSFIGDIEYRLMKDERGFLMTPDEYYDAHKRATYDAWNDIAKQVISGRTNNIMVGADGSVSDPSLGGGAEIPEDDPDTPLDESSASAMGAALSVLKQIERVLDRFDTYYGGVNGTPATTQIACENGMALLFPFDEALLDMAATAYYDYRATNGYISYNQTTAQQTRMYCDGYGFQAFGRVIVELTGWSETKQEVVAKMIEALLPEFWTEAAAKGALVPSTLYLEAPCTPIAPATVTIPYATGGDVPVNTWKADHRMLIEVQGLQTDIMGNIQDPFWFVDYASGNRTFITSLVLQQGSTVYPTANQVPYRSDHKYSVTLESTGAFPFATRVFRYGGMNATNSNTMPFVLTVYDLGEG